MKNESILYWLWLSERCGVASRGFGALIRQYENPFDLYRLEDEEIEQLRTEREQLLIKIAAQSDTLVGLMQYKLEAEERRRALEDAVTAQERRERELIIREGQFAQELAEARREAADAATATVTEEMTKELDAAKQETQRLVEAKDAMEVDLQGKISALEQYAAACREYTALPAWRRLFVRPPVSPVE
jgi:hypothetical protein